MPSVLPFDTLARGSLRPQAKVLELPALRSVRLLDQVRERLRGLHYSLRTEDAYLHWCRAFIRFHGRRHPAEMGAAEVEAFLTFLAAERSVAASTHNQALSALLFLYGKVLQVRLPWLSTIGRPTVQKRRVIDASVLQSAAPWLHVVDPAAHVGNRKRVTRHASGNRDADVEQRDQKTRCNEIQNMARIECVHTREQYVCLACAQYGTPGGNRRVQTTCAQFGDG